MRWWATPLLLSCLTAGWVGLANAQPATLWPPSESSDPCQVAELAVRMLADEGERTREEAARHRERVRAPLPEQAFSFGAPWAWWAKRDGADMREGWSAPPPSPATLRRLHVDQPLSAFACENARRAAQARRPFFTLPQAEALLRPARRSTSHAIYRLGLPILGPRNAEAIVPVEFRLSGMGCGQELLLYRKAAGAWRLEGRKNSRILC